MVVKLGVLVMVVLVMKMSMMVVRNNSLGTN